MCLPRNGMARRRGADLCVSSPRKCRRRRGLRISTGGVQQTVSSTKYTQQRYKLWFLMQKPARSKGVKLGIRSEVRVSAKP